MKKENSGIEREKVLAQEGVKFSVSMGKILL